MSLYFMSIKNIYFNEFTNEWLISSVFWSTHDLHNYLIFDTKIPEYSADMCIDQCCITPDLVLLIWTIGDARIRGDVLFRYIKKRGKCCTCGLKNIWTLSNRHLMTLAGSLFTFLKGEKNTRGIISNLKSYYSYSGHVLVQWTDNWILNNTYKMTNRSSLFLIVH